MPTNTQPHEDLSLVPRIVWQSNRMRRSRGVGWKVDLVDQSQGGHVMGTALRTVEFVKSAGCKELAEIGIGAGDTSEGFARQLNGVGALHLFDFADKVELVKRRLQLCGFQNVIGHGNSAKLYDDYNWSLMRLIRDNPEPLFDYAYVDGAHTWHHDALAFFLLDKLLKVGGFIEFDDYLWSHRKSPTVNPRVSAKTRESFTDEQIEACQIRLVVDLLVERDCRYTPVKRRRIYQKCR